MTALEKIRIAAPVCSTEEARAVIAAGADELYCGAMLADWWKTYGSGDLLSRRQGRQSHITTAKELAEVAATAGKTGCTAALTLNARYTRGQEKMVLDLANMWEDMGGRAVMVSDIGILLALAERRSRLKRYLSLLAGVFNSGSARFFSELGVSRIVLPRHLAVGEIRSIVKNGPAGMAYELLILNQKCQFIDGMCNFYHDLRLPADVPSSFDYEMSSTHARPEVLSIDPDYEGHGCQIPWQTGTGPVVHLHRDDWNSPHCSACLLPQLYKAGVHYFKIAGRGFPFEVIIRSVSFLRKAIDTWRSEEPGEKEEEIKKLYARIFKTGCGNKCYYNQRGG